MVRVTVELLPFGAETRKRHLGTMEISNDGSGGETVGNYRVRLSKWSRPDSTWRTGEVMGFQRRRRGPWDLLLVALLATVGDRLPKAKKGDEDR